MDIISIVVGLLAGIIAGGAIVFVVVSKITTRKRDSIISEAESQAETIMKEKMVKDIPTVWMVINCCSKKKLSLLPMLLMR